MIIGARVAERREALGLTQTQLAEAVTKRGFRLSQTQVSAIELGDSKRPRCLPELAAVLGTTQGYLNGKTDDHQIASATGMDTNPFDARQSDSSKLNTSEPRNEGGRFSGDVRELPVGIGWGAKPDLPVYGADDLGDGIMVLSAVHTELAVRPHFAVGIPGAFAVYIANNAMFPAYRRGDRALILRNKPVNPEDDILLLSQAIEAGITVRAAVRQLLEITDTHWYCQQWNPAKKHRWSRAEWPIAYRIESVRRR